MGYLKKYILVMTCLLLSALAYSQKEANNWFFGSKAGLTWSARRTIQATGIGSTPNATLEGLPTNINSEISTGEGCFTLSDRDGNLLFYSDGMKIYNKNHQVMPNGSGLYGHNSSAQSGIIMPYLGSTTKYIAISIDYQTNNRLSYSIVDMTLEGGLGDVVSGQKNILFSGGKGAMGESVSTIRHANGKDFWVVSPGRGPTTYFNAWLVTSEGVKTTNPVISQSAIATLIINHNGYLKFTPDGKYFALALDVSSLVLYGKFDSSTGKCYDIGSFPSKGYGIEFSNSGKYMYVQDYSNAEKNFITAVDFEKLVTTGVLNKKEIQKKSGLETSGALQMGLDGRIYGAVYGAKYLYLIENPEEFDNLRIYRLENFLTGTSYLGLPSFSASWFDMSGDESVCVDKPSAYSLSISGMSSANYVVWNFGDGTVITEPLPSGNMTMFKEHIYKYAKNYDVTISIYDVNDVLLKETLLHTKVNRCSIPVNHNITNMKY